MTWLLNNNRQVIMIGHCRSISCTRCATLQGILIIGDAMHVWLQGVYGKSLYYPKFCCEPKTTQQKLSFKVCEKNVIKFRKQ